MPTTHIKRMVLFAVFGVSGFFLSIGIMYLFVSITVMNQTAAYILQTIIAVSVNYLLNWRFTWNDRRVGFWRSACRFSLSRIVMIALNTVLFAVLVDYCGVHYQIANIGLMMLFTVVNYIVSHTWLFAEQRAEECATPTKTIAG